MERANPAHAASDGNGADSHTDPTRLALRGTAITLLLRLASFLGTQWTLRAVAPDVLGRASVQLELLLTSVLFVGREGFRLALTRNLDGDSDGTHWSVAWLSVPVSVAVAALAALWHWASTSPSTGDASDLDYRLAGILFCVSCVVEGAAEPFVLDALRHLNVGLKASAEGLATVTKTAATVVFLQYLRIDWPVTAFGLAQLVYAVVYFLVLWRASRSSIDSSHIWGPYDRHTCHLVLLFTLQGFFKHLLTEGDRLVLTTLSGAYDQGIYAMAGAYGSLAARILLQPMEENARLMWSRLASSTSDRASIRQLEDSFTNLVKLALYIGLVFACLAVNYTAVLLSVMAGRKWGDNAEAAAVLSAFCVYTAFMAWNGMTEAFVYSVASSGADVGRLGAAHSAVAVAFAVVASFAVARQGTVGLVAANCVAMSFRVIYSIYYAANYFAKRQQRSLTAILAVILRRMFPRPIVLLAFLSCNIATGWSKRRMMNTVSELHLLTGSAAWFRVASEHVAVGAACFVGMLTVSFYTEGELRRSMQKMWNGRKL